MGKHAARVLDRQARQQQALLQGAKHVQHLRGSALQTPPALPDDAAPSARLVPSRAHAAAMHPRAQPEQLGGAPWPQELKPAVASGARLAPPQS